MDDLSSLSSLGLALPSPAYIVGAIVFGIAGYVAFRRGRKTSRPALTWGGVALMVYPYGVPQTWLIGLALCGWLYTRWD